MMSFMVKKWALWLAVGLLLAAAFVVWRWRSAAIKLKMVESQLREAIIRVEEARKKALRERELSDARIKAQTEHDLRAAEIRLKLEEKQTEHDSRVEAVKTEIQELGTASNEVNRRAEARKAKALARAKALEEKGRNP